MMHPVVDYREFRLSRLNEPRFSHLKLLWGWVGYFVLYFLTENLIPLENCHVIHCWLDDIIPFCEWFFIPYSFWYLLVAGALFWYALYDTDCFRKLMTYIIITQVVAMAVYILYPSCQMLRPDVFERDNFLTRCLGLIYRFDTNTGVCPSLHVAYSLGIASVWLRDKRAFLVEGLCGGRSRADLSVHRFCEAAFGGGYPGGAAGMSACRVAGVSERMVASPPLQDREA